MRVIIRFSVNGENDSKLRNKLKGKLAANGITLQTATGTYENKRNLVGENKLAVALADFWDEANLHRQQNVGPGTIDHFWMYIDQQRPQQKRPKANSKTAKKNTVNRK